MAKEINKCCNKAPILWAVDNFDVMNIEKIECQECGRVVYGSDDDGVDSWNNGDDDA